MRKTFFLLLLLAVVGLLGYLVFPKTGGLPGSTNKQVNNGAGSKMANNETGTTEEDAISETTAVTEVSEGLTLSISSPLDKSTVATETLQVIGKTSPNAEVYINDQEGKADSTGNFFINIALYEGENILTVVVNDTSGNYAEKELTVYLESTE